MNAKRKKINIKYKSICKNFIYIYFKKVAVLICIFRINSIYFNIFINEMIPYPMKLIMLK